jgi:hypothetical protein
MGRHISSMGDAKYRNVYFKNEEKEITAASRRGVGVGGQKPTKVALKSAGYKIWYWLPLV